MQSKGNSYKKILIFLFLAVLTIPMVYTSVLASEDDSIVDIYKDAKVVSEECDVHCGTGEEFDVISTLKSGRLVKILSRIQNWYIIYDYDTGITGSVKTNNISLIDESGSNDITDFENPPTDDSVNTENVMPLSDEEKLLYLVNTMRSEMELGELKSDPLLSKLAYYKARDMVENNNFSHTSVSYGNPFEMMRANGVCFTIAGENISGNQTIDGAFYAMINSQMNKENMLNSNYTSTGIGVYTSPVYGKIIVQLFTDN